MRLCDVTVALRTLARITANALKAKNSKAPTSVIRTVAGDVFRAIEAEWERMVSTVGNGLPDSQALRKQKLLASGAEVRQLIGRIVSVLNATNNEFNATVYDSFVAATEGLARFMADHFVEAMNSMLEPLSKAAQQCHTDVQAVRNAGKANDVLSAFNTATRSIASFAETVSLLKGSFPPLDSEFYSFLGDGFNFLNTMNSRLAEDVNAFLRLPQAPTAPPHTLPHGKLATEILALVRDIVDAVSLESQSISGASTLACYSKTLSSILHAEELRTQMHASEVQDVRDSGANARLVQLKSEHSLAVPPSISSLASVADDVNVSLQNISFAASQYDPNTLKSVVESAQPQVGACVRSIATAFDEEIKRLQTDVSTHQTQLDAALEQVRSAPGDKDATSQLVKAASSLQLAVAPVGKHLYEGVASPQLGQLEAQLQSATKRVNDHAGGENQAELEQAAAQVAALARQTATLKEQLLEQSKKQVGDVVLQTKNELIQSVNKVLEAPGNDELAEELYMACDSLEEAVDEALGRIVPIPKSAETVLDDSHEEGWKRLDEIQSKQDMESFSKLVSTPVEAVVNTYATIRKSNNGGARSKLPMGDNKTNAAAFEGTVPEIVQDFEEAIKRNTAAAIPDFLRTRTDTAVEKALAAPKTIRGKSNNSKNPDPAAAGLNVSVDQNSQVVVELGQFGEERVVSGTLEQLIVRLTDPEKIDMLFTNAFIMTCNNIVSPEQLIDKMTDRYRRPPEAKKYPIMERTCIILKKWIDEHLDTASPTYSRVKEKLTAFILSMDTSKGEYLQKILQRALLKKESDSSEKRPSLRSTTGKPRRNTTGAFKLLGISTLLHSDSYDIACQLASVNADLFKAIKLGELRKLAWMSSEKQTKSPNVLAMIRMFNLVAVWVAASILEEKKLKRRVKMISKMVVIASFLRQLGDFQGTMSILAGLSMASVKRLTWTFRLMSKRHTKRLEELELEMQAEKSYSRYRAALNSTKNSVIPFLAVFLSDLAFIDEGNPDFLGERVNFAKQYLIYDLFFSFENYQRRAAYETSMSNFNLLQSIGAANKSVSEQGLYEFSLQVEPRNAKRNEIR